MGGSGGEARDRGGGLEAWVGAGGEVSKEGDSWRMGIIDLGKREERKGGWGIWGKEKSQYGGWDESCC